MDKKISILWLVIIVPICMFLGYLTNSYIYFSIEKNINILDLFNLIVTIFIAFYISHFLQKQTEKNRIEKDLIISKLSPILKESEQIKNFVKNNHLNKKKTDECLTNISNSLYYSDKFSTICKKKMDIESLKKKMFEMKRKITNGKIQNKKYILTDLTSSVKEIEQFEEAIVLQIVSINKM
ncbi:hypothetical protein [Capnocytophaga stomatis]|uniref:hypothetical protein n=1 Tax=Capnocytophaga stomatis TaxID=1848904 RepID=UPI001AD0B931|nr:hypothetical protein [Capnocytophaga stomatis]GIM48823.1 hypothetical protein CAPN003_02750 [Capnocytophaga stomatis]